MCRQNFNLIHEETMFKYVNRCIKHSFRMVWCTRNRKKKELVKKTRRVQKEYNFKKKILKLPFNTTQT